MDCTDALKKSLLKILKNQHTVDVLVNEIEILKNSGEKVDLAKLITAKSTDQVMKTTKSTMGLAENILALLDKVSNDLDGVTEELSKELEKLQTKIEDEVVKIDMKLSTLDYELATSKKKLILGGLVADLKKTLKKAIKTIVDTIKKLTSTREIAEVDIKIIKKVLKDLKKAEKEISFNDLEDLLLRRTDNTVIGQKIVEELQDTLLEDMVTPRSNSMLGYLLNNIDNVFSPSFGAVLRRMIKRGALKETIPESLQTLRTIINNIKLNNFVPNSQTTLYENMDGVVHFGNVKGYKTVDAVELMASSDGKYTEAQELIIKTGLVYAYKVVDEVRKGVQELSKNDLQKDLGLNEDEIKEYMDLVSFGYAPEAIVAKELDSFVSEMLNLSFSGDVSIETKELFTKSFVAHILQQMDSDLTSKHKSSAGKNFLKVDQNKTALKLGSSNFRSIATDIKYILNEKEGNVPSLKPIKVKKDDTLINSDTKLDKGEKDLLNKNNSTKFRFHNSVKDFLEAYEKDNMVVLKAFGYTEITDDMSIREIQATLSKNLKVKREVDIMFEEYKRIGTDKSFYLKHGITKSKRMTVRSTLTYQDSKIHREFIHSARLYQELNPKTKRNTNDIDVTNLSNEEVFEIYLNQAFDLDPDKGSKYKIFSDIRGIIDIYTDDMVVTHEEFGWLNDFIHEKDFNAIHLEKAFAVGGIHAVKASLSLRELYLHKQSKSTEPYVSTLTGEADAITSGVIIQLLQYANDDAVDLASKGGVFTEKTLNRWSAYTKHYLSLKYGIPKEDILFDMGSLIEAGAYHVNDMSSEEVTIDGHSFETPFLDVYTTLGKEVYDSMLSEDTEDMSATTRMLKDLVGELDLKTLRKMLKSPVMVFNYGALLSSIMRRFAEDEVYPFFLSDNDFRNTVIVDTFGPAIKEENDKLTEEEVMKLALDKFYNDFNNFKEYDEDDESVGTIEKEVFEKMSIEEKSKLIIIVDKDIQSRLLEVTNEYMGTHIDAAFNTVFGDLTTLRQGMKATDLLVSSLFSKEFDKGVAETKSDLDTTVITKDQLNSIVESLEKKGLGHRIEIGDNVQPLYKTEKSFGEKDSVADEDIKVYVKVEGTDKGTNQSTLTFSYTSNSGAAATISIHNIDAQVIAEAIGKNEFISIYDAIIFGANHKDMQEGGNTYQKAFINTIAKHGVFKSYYEKLIRMVDTLGVEKSVKYFKDYMNPITVKDKATLTSEVIVIPKIRMFRKVLKGDPKPIWTPMYSNEKITLTMDSAIGENEVKIKMYTTTKKSGYDKILRTIKLTKNEAGTYDGIVSLAKDKVRKTAKGDVLVGDMIQVSNIKITDKDTPQTISEKVAAQIVENDVTSFGVVKGYMEDVIDVKQANQFTNSGINSQFKFVGTNIFNVIDQLRGAVSMHGNRKSFFNGQDIYVNHLGLIGLQPQKITTPDITNEPTQDMSNLVSALTTAQVEIVDNIISYLEETYSEDTKSKEYVEFLKQTPSKLLSPEMSSEGLTEDYVSLMIDLSKMGLTVSLIDKSGESSTISSSDLYSMLSDLETTNKENSNTGNGGSTGSGSNKPTGGTSKQTKGAKMNIVAKVKVDAKKAKAKGELSNKFIGFGKPDSSTILYGNQAKEQGFPVNSSTYTSSDVVFVSVNGNPTQQALNATISFVKKAIDAGATILVDSESYLATSKYNDGERALRKALEDDVEFEDDSSGLFARGVKKTGSSKQPPKPPKPNNKIKNDIIAKYTNNLEEGC